MIGRIREITRLLTLAAVFAVGVGFIFCKNSKPTQNPHRGA